MCVCVCVVFFSRKNLLSVAVSAKSFHPSPHTKPEPPNVQYSACVGTCVCVCVPYNHIRSDVLYT
jgi:hypothetical protein